MATPFPFTAAQTLTAAQMNAITTLPINDQTASYTAVVGDVGKRIVMNVATANTVTINNSIFGVGDTIFIANKGAGTSTITAGAGVTINTTGLLTLAQHASGELVALSASVFVFSADEKVTKSAAVTTSQATTSTSYTDLATAGPAVTVATGTSALVTIQTLGAGAVSNRQFMSFAVSGATTVVAGTYEQGTSTATDDGFRVSNFVVTGLTAGSNTFTCKYKSSDGNSIPFAQRVITVVPL